MRTSIFRYIVILLLCISVWSNGYAQDAVEYFQEPIPPAPQTADMIRYGRYDTQLFTGGLNLSIPIYTLQDPDFTLPISLVYHSDTFKPRKSSGYVGQNWFLQAGGCISREVKGLADEINYKVVEYKYNANIDKEEEYYSTLIGMLQYIRRKSHTMDAIYTFSDSLYTLDSVIPSDSTMMLAQLRSDRIDYQPDIYHFSFCGYNGSFTINSQGKPVILSGDFVEISLDGLNDTGSTDKIGYRCPHPSSHIIIHTLDGYQYTFGGNLASIEYSLTIPSDCETCARKYFTTEDLNDANDVNRPSVESWYLTSIVAPNGRKVQFHYVDDSVNPSVWDLKQVYSISPQYNQNGTLIGTTYSGLIKTKQALLSNIIVDSHHSSSTPKANVSFYTISKNNLFRNVLSDANPLFSLFVDSISITYGTSVLSTAKLTYETRTNNNNQNFWHYLQSVNISGIGKYRMDYDNSVSYPSINCPNAYDYEVETNTYGNGSGNSTLGLIQKLIYPTGGYQTYLFQHNKYTTHQYYAFEHTSPYYHYKVVSSPITIVGGCRIANVDTYDANGCKIESHAYEYNNGVYYDPNVHGTFVVNNSPGHIKIKGCRYSWYDSHIGYQNVNVTKTSTMNNTSTTSYQFYTGRTINNDSLLKDVNTYKKRFDITYMALSGVPFYEPTLASVGTLLSETMEITDMDGVQSTQRKSYIYNNVPRSNMELGHRLLSSKTYDSYNEQCVLFSRVMGVSACRRLTIVSNFLVQTEETDEVENKTHIKCTAYEYDTKKRVTRHLVEGSDSRIYFERYTYPDSISIPYLDGALGHGLGYRKMMEQNRVNIPIEIVHGYIDHNLSSYITQGTLSFYSAENGTLQQTLALKLNRPITNYQYVSGPNIQLEHPQTNNRMTIPDLDLSLYHLTYDSRYQPTCNYVFNDNFRLDSIQPVGQPCMTYQWNDTRFYPTSKTTLDRTTQYTYRPYVGITSITDENGITTYYHYDTHGRLIEVYRMRNNQTEVIEAYNYHIVAP